jgi:NADPH:quinone reductase-like Zn-dependent oxidoreductase
VLGVSVAGVVVETGSDVTEISRGDRVVGMTGSAMGAHAELCALSADHCLVRLSDAVGFEDAAALPFGGTTALTFLEAKLALQPAERLLVIGASGAVGAAAVQVGRLLGARVTGVCSAGNASVVTRLGAERVIDYRSSDVFESGERWDVVLDTVGLAPLSALRRVTAPHGRIGLVVAGVPQMLAGLCLNLSSRVRYRFGPASEDPQYLSRLLQWVDAGAYAPLIDRVLPWERGAEAHARVDSGHKRGSVILSVAQSR